MTNEKEFEKYRLYILDKLEHFKQQGRQLEQRVRQLEIDYARDINNFESQITAINEATKSFPTKEEVEKRLQQLEKMDIHNIPKEMETIKQYQSRMEGRIMAYSSIAGVLTALLTILAYVYL